MTLSVLALLTVSIGLPLVYAWKLWRLDEPSRAAWLIALAEASVLVAFMMLVSRWDMAGYHTRILLLALFAVACAASWWRHSGRPWKKADGKPLVRSHWSAFATIVLFALALIYVVIGLLPASNRHELAFPLQDGDFVVAQGGTNRLLNHHSGHATQRYAADITAVGSWGFRANGILPEDVDSYAVFEAPVVSPCEGRVTSVRDGLPDQIPPRADPDAPAGNHVVMDCGDIAVELAHLRQGSVLVKVGDEVGKGDALGLVGNSGNTTEPHLHIHAVDLQSGEAVQMSFDGRIPLRNRLFRR